MTGKIFFQKEDVVPPPPLFSGSCFVIKVEDASMLDIKANLLAKKTINIIRDKILTPPFKFDITFKRPQTSVREISVSARLYISHCTGTIRVGDYLTDEYFRLNLADRPNNFTGVRMVLAKYGKFSCYFK